MIVSCKGMATRPEYILTFMGTAWLAMLSGKGQLWSS